MLSRALEPSALQGRSFADCPGSASQDLVCLHLGKPLSWLLGSVSDFNPLFSLFGLLPSLARTRLPGVSQERGCGKYIFFAFICLRISLLSLCSWLAGELPVELRVENEFSLGFGRYRFTGFKLSALLLWSSFFVPLFVTYFPSLFKSF